MALQWPLTSSVLNVGAYVYNLASVRAHARAVLDDWHLQGAHDTVELLSSEFCANAVQALADTDPHVQGLPRLVGTRVATISFRLRANGTHILIEVQDPDDRMPVLRNAGPDDESGRGLALVEALSEAWGCDPHPHDGKTTWALVRVP